ncbi:MULTISPECIES: hypothetical protein [unclassified Rhodococcus (in: high G+C Gram-positive bacteria)]|uniref:hypothetical protein n=1 Tax=Rhodococcus sp. 114MFTsu3.1 TaxID=1172184 RepID=UPI00117BD65E|nr:MULTISPECIES: hypothetical protein [unclassified Rhodococcus (in: high G+C Gram-positive bacteria)]
MSNPCSPGTHPCKPLRNYAAAIVNIGTPSDIADSIDDAASDTMRAASPQERHAQQVLAAKFQP